MLSILFVLSATLAGINISNFIAIENSASRNVQLVLEHGFDDGPGGDLPPTPPSGEEGEQGQESSEGEMPPAMPDDRLMRENYFCVLFDADGNVENSNYIHVFAITNEECESFARDIYNGKKNSGKKGDYRYKKVKEGDKTKVAVLDIGQHLDQANLSMRGSIIVGLTGYLVILTLILIMSKLIIKPSEETYKKQKVFITNASHELKTPLTIISTDVEIIEMDHGQSEWTKSIKDQVMNLTQMTNQLVTSARLEEDNASSYPMEEFSVSEVAEESVEAFAASFKNKNLEIKNSIAKDVMMNGNRYLINELFFIFFDNALKYCEPHGEVEIRVTKNKNKVEIIFSNTLEKGNNINVEQLFDRFYRDPNTKVVGTGIGLSISKQIVELHKGKISAVKDGDKIKFIVIL